MRRIALLLVLALVVGIGVLWFTADGKLNRIDALADYSGRPAQGAGTNWLIVGSDSRAGIDQQEGQQLGTGDAQEVAGSRTDSIMLLHLPDNSTKPTLVSLVRDSYVPIPGHGKDKINAAYAFGGPKLLVQTVEQATGLRIDHYMEIGFGGFANVVDDIGGVQMCLPEADNDPMASINLPAGCQTLDGKDALGYMRSRHAFAAGDYARAEHQREFIGALAHKVASVGTLINPFKSIPMATDIPKALTVDNGTHLQNLLAMGWAVRGLSSGGVVNTVVPHAGTENVSGSGDVVLWDKSKASQLFSDLSNDTAVPDSLVSKT